MRQILFTAVLLTSAAFMAAAQDSSPIKIIRSSGSSSYDNEPRFKACESPGNVGFFWIDTISGDLWRVTPPDLSWEYLGSPRGANPGHHGTYQLLADRRDGFYILNTDNGQGWWTDGTTWKIIGELSRRLRKPE